MQWWFSDAWQADKVLAVSWVFWVVASISLHELGHGFAAIRCGDDTPIALRRMTLNPFVHIPPMAWIMFALVGITWGLMPVSPNNFRGRHDDARVAAAGPAVNFGLFVLCAIAAALWIDKVTGVQDPIYANVRTFIFVGTGINASLLAFNLIPVPPLDGSRIVGDFFPGYRRIWEGPNAQVIGLVAFGLIFFVFSKRVGSFAWLTARETIDWIVGVI